MRKLLRPVGNTGVYYVNWSVGAEDASGAYVYIVGGTDKAVDADLAVAGVDPFEGYNAFGVQGI